MKRQAMWIVVAILAAVAAAAAGNAIGRDSGEDLEAARTTGSLQGKRTGAARGSADGYRDAYAAERQRRYKRAYRSAYRRAYRVALKRTPTPATAAVSAPAPRDCPGVGGPTISNVSIRFMTCGQAQGVIDTMGAISTHFTVLNFTCDRLSGGDLGGTWRCVRGQSALRFDFGD